MAYSTDASFSARAAVFCCSTRARRSSSRAFAIRKADSMLLTMLAVSEAMRPRVCSMRGLEAGELLLQVADHLTAVHLGQRVVAALAHRPVLGLEGDALGLALGQLGVELGELLHHQVLLGVEGQDALAAAVVVEGRLRRLEALLQLGEADLEEVPRNGAGVAPQVHALIDVGLGVGVGDPRGGLRIEGAELETRQPALLDRRHVEIGEVGVDQLGRNAAFEARRFLALRLICTGHERPHPAERRRSPRQLLLGEARLADHLTAVHLGQRVVAALAHRPVLGLEGDALGLALGIDRGRRKGHGAHHQEGRHGHHRDQASAALDHLPQVSEEGALLHQLTAQRVERVRLGGSRRSRQARIRGKSGVKSTQFEFSTRRTSPHRAQRTPQACFPRDRSRGLGWGGWGAWRRPRVSPAAVGWGSVLGVKSAEGIRRDDTE
jgi:hypothetical protein